jgi:hypothetical protein
MAAHFIVKPLKVFNHKTDMSGNKPRRAAGYGKVTTRFKTYDLLEKPVKAKLIQIRKEYGNSTAE